MRQSWISSLGVLALLVAAGVSVAKDKPATRPSGEPIAQLAPGKTPGTVHLVYAAKAEFTIAGHCPLVVSASSLSQGPAVTLAIDDAKDFTLEADLQPGTYSIMVVPADLEHAGYWPSDSQTIHIDKTGRLYQPRPWVPYTPRDFVLVKRLTDLSPKDGQIATEKAPLLTWPKVPGSTHFRGDYMTAQGMNWFNVDEAQFRVGSGVAADECCGWRVEAIADDGKVIARGDAAFFGQGTKPATVEEWRTATGTCGAAARVGPGGFLGIQAFPSQVPKDPSTPIPGALDGATVVQNLDAGFIPGLLVMNVIPGSPAVEADLHPDDEIIAVDGKPVASEGNMGDFAAFVQQIAAMPSGRKITLTVRRFPRELSLTAIIGHFAGATTQPATVPAAKPDTTVRVDAAPATKSQAVWRDASSGTPVVFPFTLAPGADVVNLSTKDGLAADMITKMVVLPGGGVAFGSMEGLSIWDGKEIRTYTGPAVRRTGRGNVDGNSDLPHNWIADLLVDSHKRLWVATMCGVCRIDPGPAGRWRILENPSRTFGSNRMPDPTMNVQKLFETDDGTIVIGGRGAGIIFIDPKTDEPRLIHRDADDSNCVTGIAQDKQHRLWFSVAGIGILRYEGGKIEKFPGAGKWTPGTDLRGICIDPAGTIWTAGGADGLYALHPDGTVEKFGADQLAGDFANALSCDKAGRVWAMSDDGVAVLEPKDAGAHSQPWKFLDVENANCFEAFLQAGDGSLWIGRAGVTRLAKWALTTTNPRTGAIERFKRDAEKSFPKLPASHLPMAASKDMVMVAAGKKLLRYDGKSWEDLTPKTGMLDVSQILADSKGAFWIATSGQGLLAIDAAGIRRYNNQPDHAKSVIYCLALTPDGTIYAGTQFGLYRMRGQIWEKLETDQPVFQVTQVAVDGRGRVWALDATYGGLFVFDGKHFRDVKSQTELADQAIEILSIDDAGNIVATLPAHPGEKVPQRRFRWDAKAEKIGPPTEVK